MKITEFFPRLYSTASWIKNRKAIQCELCLLEQSLIDIKNGLKMLSDENNLLKSRLKFIDDVFQKRKGCVFTVYPDAAYRDLLVTTSYQTGKKDIYAYMPHEQLQIAEIITHSFSDTLIIEKIDILFVECDAKIGKALFEEIVSIARCSGMVGIWGHFGLAPHICLTEMREFYTQAGFDVTLNIEEESGVLVHKLKDNPEINP